MQTDHSTPAEQPTPPGKVEGPLSSVPLFARLDPGEQQELFARMTPRHVEEGGVVVWHGESGESMFLIQRGRVTVAMPSSRGEHVHLASIGSGGFFGELSLLDGGPRTASVRAAEPCDLLELQREAFLSFLRSRPGAAMEVLGVLAARQRTSQAAMASRNPNEVFESTRMTWWQRVSDVISTLAASQWFTLFHLSWFGLWIGLNVLATVGLLPEKLAFDPFPFGLLTMVVSLEAIFLSIFVMVSQNRQGEKDRLRIDLDYQVNVRAEEEILRIARRLEVIEQKLDRRT